ncbi:MAG: TM0106 family RecB-like putative nuclease [Deltaproteobacteria bacterium]|nr:TM0106 family RecB-like putative nuclease [Deltaproteobacteria bacterium]
MTFTSELFEAFLKCRTKCYLRLLGEATSGNAYADWVRVQMESYRRKAVQRLQEGVREAELVVTPPATENLKAAKWRLAVDFLAQAYSPSSLEGILPLESSEPNGAIQAKREASPPANATSAPHSQAEPYVLESHLHAIERVPSEGRGRPAQFIPIRLAFTNKLTKDDRLLLAFDAFVLSKMLGREVNFGKIIHGDNQVTVKVRLLPLLREAKKLTGKMSALLSSDSPPDLVLNRHCPECEFQDCCRQKAIDKDDLSLLARMTEKERKKYHSKGIFTVTQLSYTFRPRRRTKRLRDKRERYHHSLKALAIREKKIHIVGSPELKIEGTPVYLDVEGLPDRDFYYLIGVRIGNGESASQHSLWADSVEDEGRIWRGFLGILESVEKPVLVHYGSYETTFLKRMCERFGEPPEGSVPDEAINLALNIVSFLFAQIYFPTHSNTLKHVGAWLGWKWSSATPSGTDSIIWRMNWEQSGDLTVKQNLITYNLEDCHALDLLTKALLRICSPDHRRKLEGGADPEVALADSATTRDALWRRFSSPITDFEVINKAARWDYQRDRIYFKTDKELHRTASVKKAHVKKAHPINKAINCEDLQACPFCGGKPDRQFRTRTLILYDLRFSSVGVRRWVVKYRFHYYRCGSCHERFGRPEGFWPHSEFGRNVVILVIYEMIELCAPQITTTKRLNRLFALTIANSVVHSFKASAAEYYAETRQRILAHMIKGTLIHADETPIALKDRRGYAWVFTSNQEVAYFYADTREGDLLREKLEEFRGVLVSDFYTAYDSLSCPQQKCLLHLMRDLNEAVLDYAYDEELKQIAANFAGLMKGMVQTIDRWGLKRRFLRKHLLDVDSFYRQLSRTVHQSEAALKWKERFEKNRDKLFTFLSYDGVPWNNNNAEHAIKAFARLRRVIVGLSSPKGIEDYLILLSVCQTCKYMGVDFLDFLRSGEKDIHAFADSRHGRGRRSPRSESKGPPADEVADK